jgi:hypothetical protein
MDVGCILILCGLGLTCCYFQRALGVDSGFTFNIGVYGIDPAVSFGGRQYYLDAARGEKLNDGTLRVRHLKPPEAFRLYGRS